MISPKISLKGNLSFFNVSIIGALDEKSENVDIAKDVENVSKNAGILLESAESALEVTGM